MAGRSALCSSGEQGCPLASHRLHAPGAWSALRRLVSSFLSTCIPKSFPTGLLSVCLSCREHPHGQRHTVTF